MTVQMTEHPSVDDRRARGLGARDRAPLSSHSGWVPAVDRPDPVSLLHEQDPIAISGYLGDGDTFDRSITEFAERYADQNERDFQEFVAAVGSGRLEALEGV